MLKTASAIVLAATCFVSFPAFADIMSLAFCTRAMDSSPSLPGGIAYAMLSPLNCSIRSGRWNKLLVNL